jgi:hypothetical protein
VNIWKTEPAAVVSLVSAIIALAVSFGLDISSEQTGAIMAVVVLVAGIVTRSQVYPGGGQPPPPPAPPEG